MKLIELKTTSADLMATTAKVDETGDHQGGAEDHSRADRAKDDHGNQVEMENTTVVLETTTAEQKHTTAELVEQSKRAQVG